ncbi:hypothetical protein Tco_1427363 [Tanacetum coccineum]
MDLIQKARIRWDEGVWVSDPDAIKMAFLEFYKEKFSCHDSFVILPSMSSAKSLSDSSHHLLDSMVSLEETKNADIMKIDIQNFVMRFFSSSSFPPGMNSSFFTLIPKVSNPLYIKDFRPISLIGFQYKIVAGILANRFSKSSRASILVNGSPTSEFSLKRGLRQGDPLSPFLFIIVMEGLHIALKDGLTIGTRMIMDNIIRILNVFYLCFRLEISISSKSLYMEWGFFRWTFESLMQRLFRLENNQNCLVRDRIVNGLWAWDWRRPVNGGRALADLNNLLMDIGSLNVEVDRDCVVSSLSTDGSYSVSFIRKHIDNCMIANSLPSTRWCKIIPRKVNIFMWRLLLDRLPLVYHFISWYWS